MSRAYTAKELQKSTKEKERSGDLGSKGNDERAEQLSGASSSGVMTAVLDAHQGLGTTKGIPDASLAEFPPNKSENVGWDGVGKRIEERSQGEGTKNAASLFTTSVHGQDKFAKRVDKGTAQRELLHNQLAMATGMGEHVLSADAYVNEGDEDHAFLMTPLLEPQPDGIDVDGMLTRSKNIDETLADLSKMAVFDYLTSQTDRHTPRNYMFSPKSWVMIDNDDSFQSSGKSFDQRVDCHIVEQFVEDLGDEGLAEKHDYSAEKVPATSKELPIPKEWLEQLEKGGREQLELVPKRLDPSLDGNDGVQELLAQGLDVLEKLAELEAPKLGDLYEMSEFMDGVQGLG
jgi:hypothetical protein